MRTFGKIFPVSAFAAKSLAKVMADTRFLYYLKAAMAGDEEPKRTGAVHGLSNDNVAPMQIGQAAAMVIGVSPVQQAIILNGAFISIRISGLATAANTGIHGVANADIVFSTLGATGIVGNGSFIIRSSNAMDTQVVRWCVFHYLDKTRFLNTGA